MREYEIVYVVRPDLSDEDRAAKIERIHSLIAENNGELCAGKSQGCGSKYDAEGDDGVVDQCHDRVGNTGR